jgi:hypothetical protein
MFTLNFPIVLPDEHFFFDNGQYAVPPLPGGLSIGCIHNEGAPVVLQISGFKSAQEAVDFCPALRTALRLAALDKGNANGKRGAVTGLVKQTVLKAGRSDWGAVGKSLDELYAARNALVHDAQSVTNDQLVSLKIIVKDTLKTLAN